MTTSSKLSTRFTPICVLLIIGLAAMRSANAENWKLIDERKDYNFTEMRFVDATSIRAEGSDIAYVIKYQRTHGSAVKSSEKTVVADCRSKQRFEVTTSTDWTERNFKSVYPNTSIGREVDFSCSVFAGEIDGERPAQMDEQRGAPHHSTVKVPATSETREEKVARKPSVNVSPVASVVPTTPQQSISNSVKGERKTSKGCKSLLYDDATQADGITEFERMDWTGRCVGGFVEGEGTLTARWKSGLLTKTVGTFRKGVVEGAGSREVTYPDGRKTFLKGDFVDGVASGKGRLESPDSVYEGEFRDMRFQGQGTLRYTNGFTIGGYFSNGSTPTSGHIEYPSGVVFDGQMVKGRPEGQGRMTFANMSVYAGEFSDGKPHGEGTHTSNGKTTNVRADKGQLSRRYDAAELAEFARIEEQRRNYEQQLQEQAAASERAAKQAADDLQSQRYLCLARAAATPTGFGSAGEKFANMAKCNQDVNTEFQAPQIAVPVLPTAPALPRQVYCYTTGAHTTCREQ